MDETTENWLDGQRSNGLERDNPPAIGWTTNEHDPWPNLQNLHDIPLQYSQPAGDSTGVALFPAPPNHSNAIQLPYADQLLAQSHGRNCDGYLTGPGVDTLRSPFQHPRTPRDEQNGINNTSWLDVGIPETSDPYQAVPPSVERPCGCQSEVKQLRQEIRELRSELHVRNQEVREVRSGLAHVENHSIPKIATYVTSISRWAESVVTGDRRPSAETAMMNDSRSNEGFWRRSGGNASDREMEDWEQQDERSPSGPGSGDM